MRGGPTARSGSKFAAVRDDRDADVDSSLVEGIDDVFPDDDPDRALDSRQTSDARRGRLFAAATPQHS